MGDLMGLVNIVSGPINAYTPYIEKLFIFL